MAQGKRTETAREGIDRAKFYPLPEAAQLIKSLLGNAHALLAFK